MTGEDRKTVSVWLKTRHQKMLEAMPGVQVADITRRAIEEIFESRNDREYAKLCIEEDLAELVASWERLLGLKTGVTVTETHDGFRVVLVPLKRYGAVEEEPDERRAFCGRTYPKADERTESSVAENLADNDGFEDEFEGE